MNTFSVGEIAILQNCDALPCLNNEECTVIRGLGPHLAMSLSTALPEVVIGYVISTRAGEFIATAENLRKKGTPEKTAGEWSILKLFKRKPVVLPEMEPA